MARSGLYKSDVKKARDALLAQGKHPSVDAVRIALGNTGSKTTIHKYLKELEEEEGGPDGRKTSISEALQDLVERLAAQLQDEANARIDEMRAQSADNDRQHAETVAALRQELDRLGQQVQQVEFTLDQERAAHGQTRAALQAETIGRSTAEQQVADLKERLAENETYRLSLEDKHKHAREALEHYRQSVKDQRDQDQRRHEQQIQQLQAELRQLQQTAIVKQDDITRLNQEGARLVAELSQAQKSLYDEQGNTRRLAQKLEALQTAEQRNRMLEAQLAEKTAQVQALSTQLDAASGKVAALSEQVRGLDLALATAQAKQAAQQEMVTELRAYLESHARPPTSTAGSA